ncbi:hypothetical protein [Marivita sp. GX14005]|uniref:hypothetical protein n=1 Tax=Marivita sp. GX14005 TaxID=2942276 RepID=UPI002018C046|nr:hypothetical protein [Marivita sp. GX14005]MCL3881443.1 hypothetical protein [Marivita sp. GX14005]
MYSRFIAWLKILLPLGALVLLSTVFLYSRGPDPVTTVPLLSDGTDPTDREQVGRPFYAGTTEAGHALTLAARRARGGNGEEGVIADDLRAVVKIGDGNRIVLDAASGQLEGEEAVNLSGGVTLESSSGYTVRTEVLNAALDRIEIESGAPVDADGPGLTLSAGKLRVQPAGETDEIELLFTDGVKLVYVPQEAEAE